MADSKAIAKNLRAIRADRGYTCGQLGKKAGISENTVLRHEHGYDMTVPQLLRYAEALECSPLDILYGPLPPAGEIGPDADKRFDAAIEELGRQCGLEVVFMTREEIQDEIRNGE